MKCDECGYDDGYSETRDSILIAKIQRKRLDLQDQLIQHAYSGPDGQKLSETDVIRYSAMVEVLKAVLQWPTDTVYSVKNVIRW